MRKSKVLRSDVDVLLWIGHKLRYYRGNFLQITTILSKLEVMMGKKTHY